MKFKEELSQKVNHVESVLDKYIPAQEDYQKIIMEAMEYSLKAGGKRIRPLLMMETYRMFGGNGEIIESFMAGMEMLHTYSLVHDDLPAMDNDEYRRGRKTTHIVFGEAMGILAGDALLNYAYETSSKAFDYAKNDDEYKMIASALRVFMKKAGIYGMIGGQVVDVINEGKQISKEMLDFIFKLKTGALLEASVMIGAILAGAGTEDTSIVEKIGCNIGLAFQIQDDVLDVVGDEKVLGKPILSDEKNNKTTYVTLYGLDKAREDVEKYSTEALELIKNLENSGKIKETEFFKEVVKMLINRDK